MSAVTWQGKHDIPVKEVPNLEIEEQRDIILRVTTTAICGSDLHLYDDYIPTIEKDNVLGHEFRGFVVPERLELARKGGAETLNDENKDVQEELRAMSAKGGTVSIHFMK